MGQEIIKIYDDDSTIYCRKMQRIIIIFSVTNRRTRKKLFYLINY
jgi:hypothetical protein